MRSSRAPPQRERAPPNNDRIPTPRIPTKPTTGYTTAKSARDAPQKQQPQQHVSQMGKRAVRGGTSSAKPAYDTSNSGPISKRASATTDTEAARARALASAVPRQETALSPPLKTPSLVSAASTRSSSRSNLLRRKPSIIEQYKRGNDQSVTGKQETNVKKSDSFNDAFDSGSPDITVSSPQYQGSPKLATVPSPPLLSHLEFRDITPPVHTYAHSVTPSTRYADSPFSHAPSLSSASSYSPVLITKTSTTPRQRPQSPTCSRPPVTGLYDEKSNRVRLGLPPVRESSTSSSNATVKPSDLQSGQRRKGASTKPVSVGKRTPVDTRQQTSRPKVIKDEPKQARSASSYRTSQQIPPELAHLNVDPPPRTSRDRGLPPSRPSRDGTPMLTGIEAPSPVVQSDLSPLYITYHKRTPSLDAQAHSTSPSLRTRLGFHSKPSPAQPSPRVDSAIYPPSTIRGFSRGPTPDILASDPSYLARKDSPAVSDNSGKSARFGLFSRKSKVDSNNAAEKPKRQPSKGPVAGTGHEGYGRFGLQRRSSSTGSSAGRRSPSSESTTSSQRKRPSTSRKSSGASNDENELDEFLRERLNPVVLRGGGRSGSTVSNTTSYTDMQNPSGTDSSHNSSLDSIARSQLLPSALDIVAGISPTKTFVRTNRAPSDSIEDNVTVRHPSLKRSALVSQPKRRNEHSIAAFDRTHNFFSGNVSSSRTETKPSKYTSSKVKEVVDTDTSKAEAERKAPRKWNFFQRTQASPRDQGKPKQPAAPVRLRGLGKQQGFVPPALYATLDSVELIGLEEVEKMIQEPETSPEDSNSELIAVSRVSSNEQPYRSLLSPPPALGYSDDTKPLPRAMPPQITIRHDSQDSSKLMYAEVTVPHAAPHVVDVRRSPSILDAHAQPEQKAIMTDLKPAISLPHDATQSPDMSPSPLDSLVSTETTSPARLPRLSPIGRIPKVVSKRDRERKLSDSSFSRPFARDQPKPLAKPPGFLYNQIRDHASPVESNSQPVSSTSTNSNPLSGAQQGSEDVNFRGLRTNEIGDSGFERGEFFSFPSRKDSDVSYSSSSGNNSVFAILAAQPPQEEDIWNEYNDLLDEVMPGMTEKARYSDASSLGAPFHYSSALYESPEFRPYEWYRQQPPTIDLPAPPRSLTVPAILSISQQRAQLMQPSISSLDTQQVISGVFSDYGRRSTSTLMTDNRMSYGSNNANTAAQFRSPIQVSRNSSTMRRSSIPEPTRMSLSRNSKASAIAQNRGSLPRSNRSSIPSIASVNRHSRASAHSRSASLPEAIAQNSQSSLTPSIRFDRDYQLLDIAEVESDEQAAAASLRFGALMTSKWLSFGRVLFSPAHNEMRLADEARILIIDGLGSDWSYYVALSYPTAMVYNLGPAPVNGTSDWPGVSERPPSNHRHITHSAISAAYPFPKGFFTAVVLRFPLATTDQAYQACIYECKRVLRPGGFIEVAALDLDLMNMGNKARKEVRGLKIRLQNQHQDVSLRNLSDMLVGIIGRRGFEDVQRCIVGVPAAGHIPKSQDIDSVSSGASGTHTWQREDRQKQEFSFADLLEDARANQLDQGSTNDENITKTVAKVGRWWYTTCYEKALLGKDDSIWEDTALLRECEKQGTSFRLLICYAQKPAQTRRRTVSV